MYFVNRVTILFRKRNLTVNSISKLECCRNSMSKNRYNILKKRV